MTPKNPALEGSFTIYYADGGGGGGGEVIGNILVCDIQSYQVEK